MWDLIYIYIYTYIIYIYTTYWDISIYIISTIYTCQAILPYKQNTHNLNHTIEKNLFLHSYMTYFANVFFFRLQVTEEFVDDHRLHDIQFQLSRFSTKCYSDIIAWDAQNEPMGRKGPWVEYGKPIEMESFCSFFVFQTKRNKNQTKRNNRYWRLVDCSKNMFFIDGERL